MELAEPTELVLRASTTATDTQWIATLLDVAPDGSTTNVTAGWLLASVRALDTERSVPGRPVLDYRAAQAVPVGDPVEHRIPLVDNARRFCQGHRLRLHLRSDDSSGEPAIMGFRHLSPGMPSRNVAHRGSRLVLSILGDPGPPARLLPVAPRLSGGTL